MGLLSFDEFANNKKETDKTEKKSVKERREQRKTRKKKPVKENKKAEQEKINETAFEVDENYKVKITFDVPVDTVEKYISQTEDQTGKSPLDNFSKTEIAEQMVEYTLKEYLKLDNVPASITVGETETEGASEFSQEKAEDDAEQVDDLTDENDEEDNEDNEGGEDGDGLIGASEDDLEEDEKEEKEKPDTGSDEIEFEGDEINLGEEIETEDEDKKGEGKKEESKIPSFSNSINNKEEKSYQNNSKNEFSENKDDFESLVEQTKNEDIDEQPDEEKSIDDLFAEYGYEQSYRHSDLLNNPTINENKN